MDVTPKVPKMNMHKYTSTAKDGLQLKLTGDEVTLILSSLSRVHSAITAAISSTPKSSAADSIDLMHSVEDLYHKIMTDLKLIANTRSDVQ